MHLNKTLYTPKYANIKVCHTSPTNILSSMSKSNADLIKEIAELKRALEKSKLETWEAQVDALAHKKLLEHMENKYQISVKKKTNSQ